MHPRLVTTDDWPEAELRAAVLAGELVAVGPCWASPAEPQTPSLRAEAFAWALRGRELVACAVSAAWIWGAVSRPPEALEVCFPPRGRGRIDPAFRLREARLQDDELVRLGALPVTTPLRTATDLLRSTEFASAEVSAVAGCSRWERSTSTDSARTWRPSGRSRWCVRRSVGSPDSSSASPR